jgi:equilibrative nucleoside transporter 1/2/3
MALDYFTLLYPEIPFAFILPIVYNCCSVSFFVLSMLFAHHFSARLRLLSAFLADFVCLCLVPVFATTLEGDSLYITFACVAITGGATAVLMGSSVGVASAMGTKNVTAVMIGQGFAGIVPAIIRIITKAALPADKEGYLTSGIIYFATSGVVIAMCFASVLFLEFHPSLVDYKNKHNGHRESESKSDYKPLLDEEDDDEDMEGKENANAEKGASVNSTTDDLEQYKPSERKSRVGVWPTFKVLWKEAVATFFVFFVTLSLFPGMTNRIQSTNKAIGGLVHGHHGNSFYGL